MGMMFRFHELPFCIGAEGKAGNMIPIVSRGVAFCLPEDFEYHKIGQNKKARVY